jgi:hypothetical protein
LFAATESLGRPDAFMARELTDSVLHFLAADAGQTTPTTAQIADWVVKVVRELGQPALAHVLIEYAQQREGTTRGAERPEPPALPAELARWVEAAPPPVSLTWRAGEALLREYSLQRVFTRDLVAAQAEGLLTLTGLEAPLELAGCVLPAQAAPARGVRETVEQVRSEVAGFIAIDAPEHMATPDPDPTTAAADYVRELRTGLQVTHLRAVLNLNSASPPAWAGDLAEGPLFARQRRPAVSERFTELAGVLAEQSLTSTGDGKVLRVDWHLSERDFQAKAAGRLLRLARWAVQGADLAFVFDRPRRPVPLAEGLDRQRPALLLAVGLQLPRLAEMTPAADPDRFLQKLRSLARFALSAAVQKRDFLRRHSHGRPGMSRGFLLERARLLVVPVGLEAAVRTLRGEGLCAGGSGLEFAREVVGRLQSYLRQDGPACQLETCLDGIRLSAGGDEPGTGPPAEHAAGLTPWDPGAPAKNQLRAASPLHLTAEMGTVAVLVPADAPPTAEEVVRLLTYAWQQTEVVRVCFLRAASRPRQLTAPWAAEQASAEDTGGTERANRHCGPSAPGVNFGYSH